MTNLLIKVRDILADNYKFNSETQEYYTSKIFSLQDANIDSISLLVYKNGAIIPTVSASWTRTGTVVTITKTAHGLIDEDVITLTISSVIVALPLGTYTITKLTADTFTVVGLSAGATSGTCTYNNYSYSTTNGKITIVGTLTAGEDSFTFTYNAYEKYSDAELQGYIRSALYYLTAEKYKTFKILPPTSIFPTPAEDEECLIAIIAAILIKGSIRQYRTPEITITFGENLSTEQKIKQAINQFSKTFGTIEYTDLSEEISVEEDDDD
jgi:hypothetical protein